MDGKWMRIAASAGLLALGGCAALGLEARPTPVERLDGPAVRGGTRHMTKVLRRGRKLDLSLAPPDLLDAHPDPVAEAEPPAGAPADERGRERIQLEVVAG